MNHNQYPAPITRVPTVKCVSAHFSPDIQYHGKANWSNIASTPLGRKRERNDHLSSTADNAKSVVTLDKCTKRENQQDTTIRCLLLTSVSTCFGHHYAHLQENKGPVTTFGVLLASYKAAPHNRYQPHPAEPEQHTKCSNRAFVLLKMGIMMPETC